MARTIVITGAGAGIGAEAARRFSRAGWSVCATDVNQAALAGLRKEIGEEHTYALMDVTDPDQVTQVLAEFAGRHGGAFDALLNNAGVAFIDNFEELTLAQHALVVAVNVNGVLNCTHLPSPTCPRASAPPSSPCARGPPSTVFRARPPTRPASSSCAGSPRP